MVFKEEWQKIVLCNPQIRCLSSKNKKFYIQVALIALSKWNWTEWMNLSVKKKQC